MFWYCCTPAGAPHPPRMVTCELSRVCCWLRRRQQQISTCRPQEEEKSLSRAENGPRRLSQKVCESCGESPPPRLHSRNTTQYTALRVQMAELPAAAAHHHCRHTAPPDTWPARTTVPNTPPPPPCTNRLLARANAETATDAGGCAHTSSNGGGDVSLVHCCLYSEKKGDILWVDVATSSELMVTFWSHCRCRFVTRSPRDADVDGPVINTEHFCCSFQISVTNVCSVFDSWRHGRAWSLCGTRPCNSHVAPPPPPPSARQSCSPPFPHRGQLPPAVETSRPTVGVCP